MNKSTRRRFGLAHVGLFEAMEPRRHLAGDWYWPNDVAWPSGQSPYLGGDDTITVVPGTLVNTWDVWLNGAYSATSPADLTSIRLCTIIPTCTKIDRSAQKSVVGQKCDDLIQFAHREDT